MVPRLDASEELPRSQPESKVLNRISKDNRLADVLAQSRNRAVRVPIHIPWGTNEFSGPEKIRAANEPQAMMVKAAVTKAAEAVVTALENP